VKVALYARVSTLDKNQDPELQLRDLRDYCASKGWEIVGEYVDIGISGSRDSRPELNRLTADANAKSFDAVLVWRFDRFARSSSHLLRALESFRALSIDFVSLNEAIDTSTPMGKMVFTVLGAVAELERELIRERVKAGMRKAKAKGKQVGRKPVQIDRNRLQAPRSEGLTMREMAAELGVSLGLVHKIGKPS
jgi:DNA invertase Pin-like site-specific DNA recombinase